MAWFRVPPRYLPGRTEEKSPWPRFELDTFRLLLISDPTCLDFLVLLLALLLFITAAVSSNISSSSSGTSSYSSNDSGNLFESLPQIVRPVQRKRDKLLPWTLSACVRTLSSMCKPHRSTSHIQSPHRSLQMPKMAAVVIHLFHAPAFSFSGIKQTWNSKPKSVNPSLFSKACKGVSKRMFWFHPVSFQSELDILIRLVLSSNDPVCLHLLRFYSYPFHFSIWKCKAWNWSFSLLLTFHISVGLFCCYCEKRAFCAECV
jgi:hypothetical protein